MGWYSRIYNQHGDRIFVRGGDNGFSGSYIEVDDKKSKIEHEEIFEDILLTKLDTMIHQWVEQRSIKDVLKSFGIKL